MQHTNSQTNVTIKPVRVLHFSDGIEEEIEEVDTRSETKSEPHLEEIVDPSNLPWGAWLSHFAWKSGTKVLSTVDYVGEGLANFFGITTPKYQLEINEYERLQEEKRKMEEETAGWVPNNKGGDIPLVLQEPAKECVNIGNNV